jgi:hypothetical protein
MKRGLGNVAISAQLGLSCLSFSITYYWEGSTYVVQQVSFPPIFLHPQKYPKNPLPKKQKKQADRGLTRAPIF